MSTPQLLSPDAVAMIMHRQGYHNPREICMTREFPECFGKRVRAGGKGESLSVAFSIWQLAILHWEVLERNRKISLQGSSTEGPVVKLLILKFHPAEKISEYN